MIRQTMIAALLMFVVMLIGTKAQSNGPNITSITGNCNSNGCWDRDYLTIVGLSLMGPGYDDVTYSIITTPDPNSYCGDITCDLWGDGSTPTLAYCFIGAFSMFCYNQYMILNASNSQGSTIVNTTMRFGLYQSPSINQAIGCTVLSETANDQCLLNSTFLLYGGDWLLPSSTNLTVEFSGGNEVFSMVCPYIGISVGGQSTIQCSFDPSFPWKYGVWYSYRVQSAINGIWSERMIPGARLAIPGSTPPVIYSANALCNNTGCTNGTTLIVQGEWLLDSTSHASVSLAPSFYIDPPFLGWDCPIDFPRSNATVVYCTLPVIRSRWFGYQLSVKIQNAYGDTANANGPTYAGPPVSSSSSSTGSQEPIITTSVLDPWMIGLIAGGGVVVVVAAFFAGRTYGRRSSSEYSDIDDSAQDYSDLNQ